MVVYSRLPNVSVSTRLVRPIFNALFFIIRDLALAQDTTHKCYRQPYNIAVRTFDPRDKTRRKALNCVSAGAIDTTRVWFDRMTDRDISWYVATGEPVDRAGAYAIQGFASRFIPRIEGSYSNVVGLPVALVSSILSEG